MLHYAEYSCYVAAVVRWFVGQLHYTQDVLLCPSRTQTASIWGSVTLRTSCLCAFLSLVFWSSCPIPSLDHDMMLPNQVVIDLPCPLDPGIIPCIICSKHSPYFRMTCPKQGRFLLFADFSKSHSTHAVSITQLFVSWAGHDTLRSDVNTP